MSKKQECCDNCKFCFNTKDALIDPCCRRDPPVRLDYYDGEKIMQCPICKELDKKSCIYPEYSTETMMGPIPYYDEDGFYHCHDPNLIATYYNCTNGHRWAKTIGHSCKCGWTNEPKNPIKLLKTGSLRMLGARRGIL